MSQEPPFTVDDLIEKLLAISGDLHVAATKRGSLRVDDPNGRRFGYVFMERDRPIMWLTDRSSENHKDGGG